MRRFRGVIEDGFCVRRTSSFLPDTEQRYFVFDGVPHSPAGDVPPIVHECAKRHRARFYSVDVVQPPTANFAVLRLATVRFRIASDGHRSGSPKFSRNI